MGSEREDLDSSLASMAKVCWSDRPGDLPGLGTQMYLPGSLSSQQCLVCTLPTGTKPELPILVCTLPTGTKLGVMDR